jgi:hypothetical protein
VVFIEAAQNSTGQNLAQIGASDIDGLVMGLERLLTEELYAIDQKTPN